MRFNGKKIILTVLITLFGLIFLGMVAGYFLLKSGLPDYSVSSDIAGVHESVTIHRDERGKPHIYGDTLEDIFFGQGFVHAQDRLWQLELHRRASQGRLSEIIGGAGLEMDREFRTMGLTRVGRRLMENSSPETIAIAESYVAGINALLSRKGVLPPELRLLMVSPEPWKVEEVFFFAALVAYQSARNAELELMRLELFTGLEEEIFRELLPAGYSEKELEYIRDWKEVYKDSISPMAKNVFSSSRCASFYTVPGIGSNSWAVSPERSANGNPLFAFDSHDAISFPCNLYEVRLLPDERDFEIFGWSVPGLPGIINGYNRNLAWGMTTTGDTQDLFLEKRHPEKPYLFKYDSAWYEADVYLEEIKVRGRRNPVEHEVIVTRNGPLIEADPPVSIAWTGNYIREEGFDALIQMNLSRNWEEFREALAGLVVPASELVYADTGGNIASRTVGMIPLRKRGSGIMPSPGWDADYGWEGFIPMDELPEQLNPPGGFVAAANYKPAGADYPYIITVDTAPSYRVDRIRGKLEEDKLFTVDDFKQLQTDWYNLHAARRLPDWLQMMEKEWADLGDFEAEVIEILNQWVEEPVNKPEAAGAAVFETWYIKFLEESFRREMGDELYNSFMGHAYLVYEAAERFLDRGESSWLAEGLDAVLMTSFSNTVTELREVLGDEPGSWRWDILQQVYFDHELGKAVSPLGVLFSRGPYHTGGGPMTVARAAYRLNRPFRVNHVSSVRTVAVMSDEPEVYAVIPGGQSGHLFSPHYDDQLMRWLEGEYFRIKK